MTSNWDGAVSNGALVWDNVPGQCHNFQQVYGGSSQIYQYKLPYDGPGDAAAVTGDFHDYMLYDSEETWHLNINVHPGGNSVDAWSIAAHEFGHTLSLQHTFTYLATMYPVIDYGSSWARTLEQNDRDRIRGLYGC
jgi:hypothetical protein